jgi:hypothetical protein
MELMELQRLELIEPVVPAGGVYIVFNVVAFGLNTPKGTLDVHVPVVTPPLIVPLKLIGPASQLLDVALASSTTF